MAVIAASSSGKLTGVAGTWIVLLVAPQVFAGWLITGRTAEGIAVVIGAIASLAFGWIGVARRRMRQGSFWMLGGGLAWGLVNAVYVLANSGADAPPWGAIVVLNVTFGLIAVAAVVGLGAVARTMSSSVDLVVVSPPGAEPSGPPSPNTRSSTQLANIPHSTSPYSTSPYSTSPHSHWSRSGRRRRP